MRLRMAATILAALIPILPATVAAQSTAQANDANTVAMLEPFGFFGEWATRCDRPASTGNVKRSTYVSASGEPGFSESLGATRNIYRILDARTAGNVVALEVELNDTIRQILTMRRDGDRIRTIRNQLADGRVLVDDGKVVANGMATPSLKLCGKTPESAASRNQ